jgi:hypothetical protein
MTLTLRPTKVGESLDKYVGEMLGIGAFGRRYAEYKPISLQNAYMLLSENDVESFRYREGD